MPEWVERVAAQLTAHLDGKPQDFSGIPLDLKGVSPFHTKVYQACARIPSGKTASYGQVAVAAGSHGAARAVGQAMGRNPIPLIIPCHRVIGSTGRPVGFSSYGGCDMKAQLLAIEGVGKR